MDRYSVNPDGKLGKNVLRLDLTFQTAGKSFILPVKTVNLYNNLSPPSVE